MRLFAYYAVHSFVNQLKKIFKTWVMIFILVCFVVGIAIGLFAVGIERMAEKHGAEAEVTQDVEDFQEDFAQEEPQEFNLIRDTIGYPNFIELLAGGLIIIFLVFSMIGADKNAGKIFLPADVNLLFPSPMKPQSVMMFRIATQFGQMIFIGVYLLFQLPNLVLNAGLNVWSALALILAFCMTTFFGTLLQLLLYLLGSLSVTFKRLMRPGITVGLAVVAGAFFLYQRQSGQDLLSAASGFFNAEGTRYVPVWGWMKGFCRAAIDENVGEALLFLGLLGVGAVLLMMIIWNLKADFYEDAMAKSEEVAELLEAAKSQKAGFVIKRKKDRSDKLVRDGMRHGAGASVFFFKNMYNRFRFAHFRFLTKTMEFYLIVAVAVGIICKYSIGTPNVLILAAVFAVMVFFRSMGNPLEADTKMDYFIMIPENTWAKLFYSLFAGILNTAMDLFLPMIVGALIMGANPLHAVLWILAILSVDAYSTTVGVFIGLSVPTSAGLIVKQMVQVMFVYFGLIPDVAVLAIGIVLGHVYLGVAAALCINLALAALFFSLSPLFLEPHGGTRPQEVA